MYTLYHALIQYTSFQPKLSMQLKSLNQAPHFIVPCTNRPLRKEFPNRMSLDTIDPAKIFLAYSFPNILIFPQPYDKVT